MRIRSVPHFLYRTKNDRFTKTASGQILNLKEKTTPKMTVFSSYIQTAMGDGMLVTPFRKKARAAAVIICH